MTEKKFKNSILIEGDYSFNYLTNLLFLSKTCIISIFEKKGLDAKKDKKIYKNVLNLCDFINSSIDVFSRLSIQENDAKCIIHNIEYKENDTIVQANLLTDKLSDNVIKKNKEVDDKYNEEE